MIPLDRSEVLRLGYYRQSGGGYTGGIHSREVGGLANPPESQASMSNLDSYKNEHYHPCEYIKNMVTLSMALNFCHPWRH